MLRLQARADRRVELHRGERAPAGDAHDRPADRGAAPAVVVGAGDEREVVRARDAENSRAVALQHADPARRAIRELDGDESRDPGQLRRRNGVELSGDREDERRRIRPIRARVVPLALGIRWRVERHVQHVDVLGAIARLERREQYGRVAAVRGVGSESLDGAGDALVVGDVSDVEARCRVPRTVARGGEEPIPIPRMVRVAVEIDGEIVGVREPEGRHRARSDGAERVHEHPDEEEHHAERCFVPRGRRSAPRPEHAPHDDDHDERHQYGRVLRDRQERERVERRADRREEHVAQRPHERRIGCGTLRERVHDGRRGGDGGDEHERREQHARDEHGASNDSHARNLFALGRGSIWPGACNACPRDALVGRLLQVTQHRPN